MLTEYLVSCLNRACLQNLPALTLSVIQDENFTPPDRTVPFAPPSQYEESFFGGTPPLSELTGYFLCIFAGLVFSLITTIFYWLGENYAVRLTEPSGVSTPFLANLLF